MRYFSEDDVASLPIGNSSYSDLLSARGERLASDEAVREGLRGGGKSLRDRIESYINWQRNPDANP